MSITNQSLGGRAYLVKKLMSGGFSRRKSVTVVSVILERMIDGLRRGEEVEFVYGTLVRVRNSFGQWWDVVDDYHSTVYGCRFAGQSSTKSHQWLKCLSTRCSLPPANSTSSPRANACFISLNRKFNTRNERRRDNPRSSSFAIKYDRPPRFFPSLVQGDLLTGQASATMPLSGCASRHTPQRQSCGVMIIKTERSGSASWREKNAGHS